MDYQKIKNFRNDRSPFAHRMGIVVEQVGPGYARTVKTITEEGLNPLGRAHGAGRRDRAAVPDRGRRAAGDASPAGRHDIGVNDSPVSRETGESLFQAAVSRETGALPFAMECFM